MKLGISGYTMIRNGISLDYCFEETIRSLLPVCDEVVVCDSESTDGTRERLVEMQSSEPKIRIVDWPWPNPVARGWEWFVEWINFVRLKLDFDYQIQLDADEVLSEQGYPRIRQAYRMGECLWFNRLNFWRDPWHLIPLGRTCSARVARMGPSCFWMPSDEPHEFVPEICECAVEDPVLQIFHYGFIRGQKAYHAKAKITCNAWFGKVDPRLIKAEELGEPWQNHCVHNLPYQDFNGEHPKVAHEWLLKNGHSLTKC